MHRIGRTDLRRRAFLAALPGLLLGTPARADYPAVHPRPLIFPRDHGSHPDFRTEWWYLTGWVKDARGQEYGVQITFFRNRPRLQEDNPSRFAPKQLLFAHAALADARHGRLRHDQRAARSLAGVAQAAQQDTDVRIDDWSLKRDGETYRARVPSREFDLDLRVEPTQPLLLQGQRGVSRKGPDPRQASYYYSRPHLAVSGSVRVGRETLPVGGTAWLDHEWSSEYLAREAAGWDWVGVNLDDGGALMAFRMRRKEGGVFWAAGTQRDAAGHVRSLRPAEVSFEPRRTWRSARTGATYPVAMRVQAGTVLLDLEPLMDDQELDARASVGTIYWEGAIRALLGGRRVGVGYLELTGYAGSLQV
jgi:predicted secreted hydrolase